LINDNRGRNGGKADELSAKEIRRPIPILYLIFSVACGGAEMVLFELVKGLDHSRFRPVVLCLGGTAALSPDFADAGIEIHHLGMKSLREAPFIFAKALSFARRLKPGVTHGVLFYGDLTARLLRFCRVTPSVVSAIHSTYVGERWSELALRFTDRYSDAITTVSEAVADAQIAAGSITRAKVTVIANGIDLSRFAAPPAPVLEELRRTLGLQSDDRVLLCVGRLAPEKNHVLLLNAFASVLQQFPFAKLLLAGDGPLRQQLEQQASQMGISERVCFAVQLNPVSPIFHLAEVFVLASWLEGLPMVVLEAMAAGCPMVLTSVGGIPEVVEEGRTGFLVPPNDQSAFEKSLLRMMHSSST